MSAQTEQRTAGRELVSDQFFKRLSLRVATSSQLAPELADRITGQALAYLATAAQKPPTSPTLYMSPLVDHGWHAFLEYTREYDAFFASHGWPKVHHNPCDGAGITYPPARDVLPLTTQAIEATGFAVDLDLWDASKIDCGDTCGDDGKGGNPLPTCEHST
ncbi:hypothetical protein ACIOEX_10505 [Streptomyces sp. NPDC087850]|uniref:hypothetical protein n=1 Tax=Streptomyces sp. NPDC087850 TaxID=3365809 RepID=UPI0037FCA34A